VAYRNWFALLERAVFDARAPFVLPEYLKMVLSKSIMRNVARFRIQGHGLKCDSGLYPACVCILRKLRQQRGLKMVLAYVTNVLVKMSMFRKRCMLIYFAKTIEFVS